MIPSHWENPVVYGKTKRMVSIRCDHWVIMTHLIDGCPRLPEVLKWALIYYPLTPVKSGHIAIYVDHVEM